MWQSIRNGKSGISRIERVDVSDLPTQVGAEIKDFDPSAFIDKKEIKRTDRFAQYAIAASQMAIEESGLDLEKVNRNRAGIIIGSGIGGIETLENQCRVLLEKGPGRVSAFFATMMIPNIAPAHISINTASRDLQSVL